MFEWDHPARISYAPNGSMWQRLLVRVAECAPFPVVLPIWAQNETAFLFQLVEAGLLTEVLPPASGAGRVAYRGTARLCRAAAFLRMGEAAGAPPKDWLRFAAPEFDDEAER